MGFPIDESWRTNAQRVDGLLGEKDCVAGGLGELLDTGSDVYGVAYEGELELASPTDRPDDHHTGVDPYADPKIAAETLADKAVNQHRGRNGSIGMIGELVGGAEDGQCAVAKKLVDMPTGV